MRDRRREAQPSGIKTFGSTFKNPDDPRAEGRSAGQLLEAAGCRGLEVGGARFSEKHANFVENMGEATTADVLALMAEGRRRVKEKFGVELEPEVQVLGDVEVPGGVVIGRAEEVPPQVQSRRDGRRIRPIALVVALAVVAVAVYWFGLRGSSTPEAEAQQVRVVAQIGNGKRVVLVSDDGTLLGSATGKKADQPVLPLKKLPAGQPRPGHVLEEVRVLAAAPKALRPYIAADQIRRKRGGSGTHLRDPHPLRRPERSGPQMEIGRRGACRSVRDVAQLCRRARSDPPGGRRGRTRTPTPELSRRRPAP